MNNNQNNRKVKRRSLDGISSRPSYGFSQGRGSNIGESPRQKIGGDSHKNNSVDNFKRSEGFHSSNQKPINNKGFDFEPVLIDKPKKTRRKFIFFGKRVTKKGSLSRKKKVLMSSVGALVAVMLVGGIFGYINLKKIFSGGGGAASLNQNVDPSKLRGEGDGRVNILLLGRGGEGHEAPDLTDTIIIASIDPVAKEAALVSIPRDLYVEVKSLTASMKVNAVFSTGKTNHQTNNPNDSLEKSEESGFSLMEDTLEDNLGLPIHYHAMIDFSGFEQAVDTVGGVTVDAPDAVTETLRIKGRDYFLNVQPGVQEMDGFKALAYARSRYTSPRGDFDRAERQRLIITALKDKILNPSTFGNPQKITSLVSNFGNHITTNFSIQDMQRLYELSQEIPSDKIASVGLSDPPNVLVETGSLGDGVSYVLPVAGVGDFSDIQYFLRNELKDSYLKDENASIMVLNGTLSNGLATTKAEELKSFGYTVSQIGNAPTKNYNKTVVVDLKNGENRYTQSYLERRFGVTAVGSVPESTIDPGLADFVIILGNDQVN